MRGLNPHVVDFISSSINYFNELIFSVQFCVNVEVLDFIDTKSADVFSKLLHRQAESVNAVNASERKSHRTMPLPVS